MAQTSTLRQLGFTARLGLTLIVLTLLGGLTVSGIYMAMHHENRDEQPGLTMTDIRGHYAGVNVPSPLLSAIERGHPEDQSPSTRKVLIDWLKGDRISEDYDSLDLGDLAPAEIIAAERRATLTETGTYRVRPPIKPVTMSELAALDSDGLLCDFHDLEAALDDVIKPFQDADLNQTRPFDRFNPTAEAVAKYIAESVSGRLGDTVHVDRVSVIEAPGCQATYFMPPTHR